MSSLTRVAALVCVVVTVAVAAAAAAQPTDNKWLSPAEIAKRLDETKMSPKETLALLNRFNGSNEPVYRNFSAPGLLLFAIFNEDNCSKEFVERSARFYQSLKETDDGSQTFDNLNRLCDMTLQMIRHTCAGCDDPDRLPKYEDAEAMLSQASVLRYIKSQGLNEADVISGKAGDVLDRMYPRPGFGGAKARDYCRELIKLVDQVTVSTTPARYRLLYSVCKQWNSVW